MRTRAEFAAAGWGARDISAAIEEGVFSRAGRGWYTTETTDPAIVRMISAGMRLTCISGANLHGLWVPTSAGRTLHTAYRRTPPAGPMPGLVWKGHAVHAWPGDGLVMPLEACLRHAARCRPPIELLILLESALNLQLMSRTEAEELVASLPGTIQRRIGVISGSSESGTETIVARFFRSLRVRVRQQVQVSTSDRVDMLIGEWLVVECDSRAHHTDLRAYQNDRRRDQELLERGYTVIRLTWEQVMLEWETTQAMLRRLIRRGVHRRPRIRG